MVESKLSHENKKALSPFYHEKYFLWKINVRHPQGVLHSFFIKNIFYDKMDFKLFYFRVTKCADVLQCSSCDKFPGDHPQLSSLSVNLQAEGLLHRCLPENFVKLLETIFSEHLRATINRHKVTSRFAVRLLDLVYMHQKYRN